MRGHDTIKTIFDPLAERDQIKLKKGRGKKMYQLWINPNEKKSKIHKEIYGHFSEHLERCIYEGIYVGEDSSIPNEKGMRSDVVNALKELDILCFAGREDVLLMNIIGKMELEKKARENVW